MIVRINDTEDENIIERETNRAVVIDLTDSFELTMRDRENRPETLAYSDQVNPGLWVKNAKSDVAHDGVFGLRDDVGSIEVLA